jgi:hypothetical protein
MDLTTRGTAHYLEQNPLTEPPFLADVADAEERLGVALSEVYAYYGDNEAMLANALRDVPLDPVAQENMASFYQYWETMRDALADAFGARGERHEALLAAIALALLSSSPKSRRVLRSSPPAHNAKTTPK